MNTALHNFLLFLSLLLILTTNASANHIVGGELQMNKVGTGSTFEVKLIQFWDTKNLVISTPNVGGNRDEEAFVYLYRKRDNRYMNRLELLYRSTEPIAFQNKACATSRSLNVSAGVYTGTITLDATEYADPEGYYLVWERCCRNTDINNIVEPGANGMVFYLEFPALSVPNSSPGFVIPNGQYICANRDFSMNMSATDSDGDQLKYTLVEPMRGATNPDDPVGSGATVRPYSLVTWERGISNSNIIPGASPLRISDSGILTVTAGSIGLYVFTIQVEELRNGRRIGLVRRDFQLLVIDCNDDQPAQPVIMHNNVPAQEVTFCPGTTVELQTEASQDWSYQWQLNGLNIPGATGATMTVKDSGNYSVIKSYTKKCSRDTTSQLVRAVYAEPIGAVIAADQSILCKGMSMEIKANGGALLNGQQLVWQKDQAILASRDANLQINEPGTYIVTITDQNPGCQGSDTLVVTGEEVRISLPERKGVHEGATTTLNPVILSSGQDYSYLWSPIAGIISDHSQKEAVIKPASDTTYVLTVTTPNGCVGQAAVFVYLIDKMHIPSAFSPNRDGRNDTFEIFNAKDQILEVRIYNRWGELVYFSKGYSNPWNGMYKDTPAPAGSYPYVIKTMDRNVTGTVMLLK